MTREKVIEFMEKVKALEEEYGLRIEADDPFCGRIVQDVQTREIYEDIEDD